MNVFMGMQPARGQQHWISTVRCLEEPKVSLRSAPADASWKKVTRLSYNITVAVPGSEAVHHAFCVLKVLNSLRYHIISNQQQRMYPVSDTHVS